MSFLWRKSKSDAEAQGVASQQRALVSEPRQDKISKTNGMEVGAVLIGRSNDEGSTLLAEGGPERVVEANGPLVGKNEAESHVSSVSIPDVEADETSAKLLASLESLRFDDGQPDTSGSAASGRDVGGKHGFEPDRKHEVTKLSPGLKFVKGRENVFPPGKVTARRRLPMKQGPTETLSANEGPAGRSSVKASASSLTVQQSRAKPRGGKKLAVSEEQLESLEACIKDMEAKCSHLQAALGEKKGESEAVQESVREMWRVLGEEREAYAEALQKIKHQIVPRDPRHQQGTNRGTPGQAGRGKPKRTGSKGGGGVSPSPSVHLQAPNRLLTPSASPSGAGPPRQTSRLNPVAPRASPQQPGGRFPPSTPLLLPPGMASAASPAAPSFAALGSGGRGVQPGQQQGLLAPASEYFSLGSKKDRAAGSCFLGFPVVPGVGTAQRHTGQKSRRGQRWLVDSSWMEAMRKEYADLQQQLHEAEAQREELQKLRSEKALLEETVLQFIETSERHGEEMNRIVSKVAKLHWAASPSRDEVEEWNAQEAGAKAEGQPRLMLP